MCNAPTLKAPGKCTTTGGTPGSGVYENGGMCDCKGEEYKLYLTNK